MRGIWNPFRRLHLSKQAISDLQFLTTLLTSAPINIWRRPVSLVIPRDPHFTSLSDACDNGLGGYSPLLNFQWRDLITSIYKKRDLHINSKEFIALFINVYFSTTKRMLSPDHLYTQRTQPYFKSTQHYNHSRLYDSPPNLHRF